MSVGAGSIKRATKANVDSKNAAEQTAAEQTVAATPAKAPSVEAPAKKPAASRTTTAAKPKTAKAASASVIANLSPQAQKLVEQEATGSQACHLTEELPIHLL